MVVVVVAHVILVSAQVLFGLDFGTLDFGTSDSGLTISLSGVLRMKYRVTHNSFLLLHVLNIEYHRL